MMTVHYGPGFTTCPMAGMNAPEFVAGKLDEVFHSIWERSEASLIYDGTILADLSDDDKKILFDDFSSAKSGQLAVLQQKLVYLRSTRWALMALAHIDEAKAREWAGIIINDFDKDPRPELYDEKFFQLLSEGSAFRTNLVLFRDGARLATSRARLILRRRRMIL